MRIDLHTHSHYSDGTSSPAEVVRRAFEKGVRLMILTDHDSVAGYPEALAAGEKHGIQVKSGVEINTRENDLHVLGYGIDPKSPVLSAALVEFQARRHQRIHLVVDQLRAAGGDICWEDVQSVSPKGDGQVLGRPHVADALKRKGIVHTRQEAFKKYLVKGKPGFVDAMGPSAEEAIAAIRGAGGMASVAHPGTIFDLDDFKRWMDLGLEGVEVYSPPHSGGAVRELLAVAQAAGLVPTGGSDYHGPGTGPDRIGGFDASDEHFARLEPRL